jgi:hypothetical protein
MTIKAATIIYKILLKLLAFLIANDNGNVGVVTLAYAVCFTVITAVTAW